MKASYKVFQQHKTGSIGHDDLFFSTYQLAEPVGFAVTDRKEIGPFATKKDAREYMLKNGKGIPFFIFKVYSDY